jgi:Spy/CpxP family protein refolding chaperone
LLGKQGIVLVAAALLAGLALGFAGSTTAYRHGWLRPPGGGPVEKMNSELGLTPAQREQVGEVMEDTRAKVGQLRRDFQRQRRKVLLNAYIQIRSLLTPGQQARFDRDFVPPRFRSEAEELQQQGGRTNQSPLISQSPLPSAAAPLASPDPAHP